MNEETKNLVESVPLGLQPAYEIGRANQPFTLYEGPLTIVSDTARRQVNGKIEWGWQPSPRIFLSTESIDQDSFNDLSSMQTNEVMVEVPNISKAIPFSIVSNSMKFGSEENASTKLGAIALGPIEHHNSSLLRRVTGHLVNFMELLEGRHRFGNSLRMGRAEIRAEGWHLTIDNTEKCRKDIELLKAQGGYAVTHTIEIRRDDNSLFSVDDTKNLIHALFWFFFLSRGLACPLVLPVGYDIDDQVVWREWNDLRADQWKNCRSWLSDRQFVNESLQQALRGFLRCWSNTVWEDSSTNNAPLRNAIHWFIAANNDAGGVEGCVILSQTALELLSWVLLVEDLQKFGPNNFDRKKAKEKFDELLQYLGVPNQIPNNLTQLSTMSQLKGWSSGPHALAEFRNKLVHPSDRNQNANIAFKERYQLLQLALWYIELTLLHLFGYNGNYMNRTSTNEWAGVSEPVPWK